MEWLFLHKLLLQHKWSLKKNLSTEKIFIHSGSTWIFEKKNPEKNLKKNEIISKKCRKKVGVKRHVWLCYWLFLTQMLTFWAHFWLLSIFLTSNRPLFDFLRFWLFSRAVGWEGFFGTIMLSILLVPFYYIILPPAFCADAVEPALNGSCRLEGLFSSSSEKYRFLLKVHGPEWRLLISSSLFRLKVYGLSFL